MKAVAYCRVSTNKDDQLNSLETQKKFFEEYAKKENHTLVKIYADEGITGTKTKNRLQFKQMMKDANNSDFDIVFVKDISRLARNTVDFLESIRALKKLNIGVQFITNNMKMMEGSEFIPTVFAAVAQEESAGTSKRIKFGKHENAKKGKVPNFVYGYDKVNGDLFNLYINDEESKIVQRIYNMYIENGHGANKIASILNSEGITTKRGSKFSQNAIVRILTNEIYIGKVINKKSEVKDFLTGDRKQNNEADWLITEKPEFRIISDELFEKAKKTLENRNKSFNINKTRHSNAYVFSTLIKCEHCGYSYRRMEHTYVNTYVRWTCSGRNAKGTASCPNKITLDEKELVEEIRNYLTSILDDRDNLNKRMVKQFNKLFKDKESVESDSKEITKQLNSLKKKKTKELDMYSNDLITMLELKERTEPLTLQINQLESQLELLSKNLTKGDVLSFEINTVFKSIEEILKVENFTNTMLKKIIEKIVVDSDGNVNIHMKLLNELGIRNTITISDYYT